MWMKQCRKRCCTLLKRHTQIKTNRIHSKWMWIIVWCYRASSSRSSFLFSPFLLSFSRALPLPLSFCGITHLWLEVGFLLFINGSVLCFCDKRIDKIRSYKIFPLYATKMRDDGHCILIVCDTHKRMSEEDCFAAAAAEAAAVAIVLVDDDGINDNQFVSKN